MKYKLGEICKIVSGTTPKTSIAEYWDGDIKWLTPAEIKDDSYTIYDTFRKITLLGKEKSGLNLFPKGTVILSSRAPIGKVAIAGCDMCCNQGFKNLICSEKVYNKYLYWFLKTKKDYLNSLGRGATFKEISKQIVSEIIIDLPSYNEQGKIVDKLERLQKIVAIRKKQLLQLDKLTKALFAEMFGTFPKNEKNFRRCKIGDIVDEVKYGSSRKASENNSGKYP
ncbi:MAG: restriction endonuclease subunit S, partial [Selenomonadaceae bacterium]|nr:restriction endonuclease subunit S [Selenomonadaceae bacterium]